MGVDHAGELLSSPLTVRRFDKEIVILSKQYPVQLGRALQQRRVLQFTGTVFGGCNYVYPAQP